MPSAGEHFKRRTQCGQRWAHRLPAIIVPLHFWRERLCRGLRGRKLIHRGRCASSSLFPPAARPTSSLARWGNGYPERLGQPFVIDNRPGAGGTIGAEAVVRSPADGYTLLLVSGSHTINATLYDNLNFNLIRDIAPVAGIYRVPQVMEVNPAFRQRPFPSSSPMPRRIRKDQFRLSRQRIGRSCHWRVVQDDDWRQHATCTLPRSPPALTDLIGGQVHVMFDNIPSSLEHIRAGRLRR